MKPHQQFQQYIPQHDEHYLGTREAEKVGKPTKIAIFTIITRKVENCPFFFRAHTKINKLKFVSMQKA